MKLELPEKEKLNRKRIALFTVILIIIIIAITVVVGVQILGNDVVNNMFGISKIVKRTEEEKAELKVNFENIIDNQFQDNNNYEVKKIEDDKNLIFTSYSKEEKNEKYEINVNLPYINIKNKTVQNFNNEIENTFKGKTEDILNNPDKNAIYTVKYKAYVENKILSVIIYSDLKQDTSAQRDIIQTFNYNLEENKELTLEDTLKIYELDKKDTQKIINDDIQAEQKKSEDLIQLGYNVFSRDLNSEIYKIENIKEYFIYNGNIYIIFAYGNTNLTTQMDIVII